MKYYKGISKASFHIQDLENDFFQDRGNYSTIPKRRRNTTPIKPTNDVCHYDICYDAGTVIGGIKYFIVFTLRTQRYTFAFSLKDLGEESLLNTVHKFVAILGHIPSRMIVDRYLKLIGGKGEEYLEAPDLNKTIQCTTQVSGVLARRQTQNGLALVGIKSSTFQILVFWYSIYNTSLKVLSYELLFKEKAGLSKVTSDMFSSLYQKIKRWFLT